MIFLRDDTIDDTVAAIARLLYNENSSVRYKYRYEPRVFMV